MERKIGERFDYNGVTLEVYPEIYKDDCNGCFFYRKNLCNTNIHGYCNEVQRTDKKPVIFKEVKK